MVRWRSVRPVAARRTGVLPGVSVLSFMTATLTGRTDLIKHVFDSGVSRQSRGAARRFCRWPDLSSDTLAQMFGNRTCDRVQFEHQSE
jgi:hypothetical protein